MGSSGVVTNSASLSTRSRRATRGRAVVGRGSVVVIHRGLSSSGVEVPVLADVNRRVASVLPEQTRVPCRRSPADHSHRCRSRQCAASCPPSPSAPSPTIVVEVPSYADAFSGDMGRAIGNAVELALGGFLELATASGGRGRRARPSGPALEGAYELGRGEARSGRSMDALLAAYRVGRPGVLAAPERERRRGRADRGAARPVRRAGVRLHRPAVGRERRRAQRRAGDHAAGCARATWSGWRGLLLAGAPPHELAAAAERADWAPPAHADRRDPPGGRVRGALVSLDARTLRASDDAAGAGPMRPSWPCCSCRTPAAAPGRRCCGRSTGGTPWSGPPARGPRWQPPTRRALPGAAAGARARRARPRWTPTTG